MSLTPPVYMLYGNKIYPPVDLPGNPLSFNNKPIWYLLMFYFG